MPSRMLGSRFAQRLSHQIGSEIVESVAAHHDLVYRAVPPCRSTRPITLASYWPWIRMAKGEEFV